MNGNIEAAFTGRLGQEPEQRTSQSGKPWLRLNVAVGADDSLQWVSTAVFGEGAQELAGRLHKGDRVYVEGRLTLRTWEKDGQTHAGLNVAAWRVERLGEIGKNKPPKPKAPSEHEVPVPPINGDRRSAPRDGQRPASPDDAIPF